MLTVVLISRNDDYGGNLLGRLRTFISTTDEYAGMYGWDAEILLVEWNPPAAEPFFEEVLEPPQNVALRIFRVPPAIHATYPNAGRVKLYVHIGRNVGIRQAAGEWILSTTQDVVFSDRLARWLAEENFAKECIYRVTRLDSDIPAVEPGTAAEIVAQLRSRVVSIRAYYPRQILHTRGCGDFLLMHRDVWRALKGGPEWGVFSCYIDGIILHAAHVSNVQQVALDPTRSIYHIQHGGGAEATLTQRKAEEKDAPVLNYKLDYRAAVGKMLKTAEPIDVNSDGWGLADCEAVKCGEFTWEMAGDETKERGLPKP